MRIALLLFLALAAFIAATSSFLSLLVPFSGSLWKATEVKHVENPYGRVEVYYDDFGVPHFVADDEKALAFAIGYIQAKDRLFQMDLLRRMMRGQLSEVFGEEFYESDEFHVKMDFVAAAEASWRLIKELDPHVAELLEVYSEGVNFCIETCDLPPEFELVGYKPEPWTPTDTLLMSKLIAWGLTGNFWDLRRAVIAERLGEDALEELYPERVEHDYPIIRVRKELADHLSKFEGREFGSNNWVVSGELTASGKPMLANDPHLPLTAPPVWYEMHIRLKDRNIRGVTFPGVPLIVIGWNDRLAWGFTNVGADVIDFYTYVWNGTRYLYKGKWLEPQREVKTIRVKTAEGFEERKVVIEKTVHGPLIEREGFKVAIAWTGLTATTEALAIYRYNYASDIEEFIEAMKYFDVPAQNVVYADVDGNTMYYPAGKYPVRLVNGKEVAGNVVFNGSNGDGEWRGFKPYGFSSWEGFILFEEIPHLINPPYVATANQEITFDYEHYLGDTMYFAEPYRAMRIYEMIEQIAAREKLTPEHFMEMQRDTYSKAAEFFLPFLLEVDEEDLKNYVEMIAKWDRRMSKDSREALVFALWLEKFVNETFGDEFGAAGLDREYYPKLFVLQNLPADSRWFDDIRTQERETRRDIAARALREAIKEIETEGYRTYGDLNVLDVRHPFSRVVSFFDYPKIPMDGSAYTVFNFRRDRLWNDAQAGSSWRMIVTFEENYCVIPGGNSGFFLSKHYSDQLEMWARGDYKVCDFSLGGERIEFD